MLGNLKVSVDDCCCCVVSVESNKSFVDVILFVLFVFVVNVNNSFLVVVFISAVFNLISVDVVTFVAFSVVDVFL